MEVSTSERDKPSGNEASKPSASERSFQPYFVLVRDQATGEYHHPHVHYVFEDDEPELLTNAAVEGLGQAQDTETATIHDEHPERQERYVLVDVSTTGRDVHAVKSLSPHWQPSTVRLASAPTFDHEASESSVMMTIGGQTTRRPLPPDTYQTDCDRVQGVSNTERISALTDHLQDLVSEYNRELGALKAADMASSKS